MTTKTARFEIVNPYQKYGLKRKPTFNGNFRITKRRPKAIKTISR